MNATIFLDQPGAGAQVSDAGGQVLIKGGATCLDPMVIVCLPRNTPPEFVTPIADAINAALDAARDAERRLTLARAL